MAATSEFGQESVLTLAMVRYDLPPVRKPAVTRNDAVANFHCYDASVPRFQPQAAVLKPDNQNATGFPYDSRLEKQDGSNQRDLFQLVHKKLYSDGRMGRWVDVTAGYGQVCQFESGIAKNTAELQQPGCAYLKASFSF
jgi:hypothetical protein